MIWHAPLLLGAAQLQAGGAGTTAPQAQAAYTWAASASAPVIGVVAPSVHAAYAWAASASPPVQDAVAPAAHAAYAWAAFARPPLHPVTAPQVSAAYLWAAAARAPVLPNPAPLPEPGPYIWGCYNADGTPVPISRGPTISVVPWEGRAVPLPDIAAKSALNLIPLLPPQPGLK